MNHDVQHFRPDGPLFLFCRCTCPDCIDPKRGCVCEDCPCHLELTEVPDPGVTR